MSLPSQFFNIPSGNSTYFQRLISSIYPTLSTDSQNAFITSITIGLSAGVNPSPSTILVALSSTSFFSIQQVQTWIGALTSNQVSSIITSSLLTTTGLTSSQIYTSSQLTTTITTTMLAASSIYQSTSNSYFVLTPWLSGLSTFFQYLTVSQLLGANILGYGILSNSIYRDVDGCNIKTTEGSPIVNYRDQFKIMPAPFMFANTYLGFPSNTYIVSIDTVNSTITMSQNATLTNDFGYNYITFGYTYVQAIMLYMFPSLSMLAQNNLLSILPSSSFFSFYPLMLTNIINQVYTQLSLPLSKSTYSSVFAAANIIGSFTTTQLQSSTYTGLTTTLLNMIPVITCTSPSVVSTLPTTNIINVSSTAPTNGYPYVVTGYGILNTLVQATSYNANTSTLTLDTYCPIGPTPGIINTISFYTLTTTTMTTTLGSNQVVTGMGNVGWLGMFVYGNGIPYGTLIIFVTANTITLSQNATLTNTNTYYVYSQTPSFTATTNGTYTTSTVPVVNSSSISPGMIVTNNVPAGTIVTSTSLSLLSLSNSVTLSINTPLSFYSATVGNVTTLTPNLSTSIQLANADYSIVNGMSVLGFDIASGTTVTSMTTTGLITLSTPVVSTITPGISLVFYSPLSAFSPPPSSPGINAANSFFSNLNVSSFPSNICKIIFPIFSSLNISAQNNIIQSLIALQQVQLLTPAHLQGLTSSQIQVLTSSQFQLFNNTQYNTVLNKLSSTQFETLNLIPQSTLLNLLGMPSYTITDLQKQTPLLVTYTANGTYTVPSGVYSLYIILNGGPGANYFDSGGNYPIRNGFSANPTLYCVSVYPGQVFNITLGTQGTYYGTSEVIGKPTTFVSASNGVSYNGPGGRANGSEGSLSVVNNSVVPISAYATIYVNYTLNSFIPTILNVQLPVLTTTQIVSLTPSQLLSLTTAQLLSLSTTQIQLLTNTFPLSPPSNLIYTQSGNINQLSWIPSNGIIRNYNIRIYRSGDFSFDVNYDVGNNSTVAFNTKKTNYGDVNISIYATDIFGNNSIVYLTNNLHMTGYPSILSDWTRIYL
jgi:trimeric autotransporter adhesin